MCKPVTLRAQQGLDVRGRVRILDHRPFEYTFHGGSDTGISILTREPAEDSLERSQRAEQSRPRMEERVLRALERTDDPNIVSLSTVSPTCVKQWQPRIDDLGHALGELLQPTDLATVALAHAHQPSERCPRHGAQFGHAAIWRRHYLTVEHITPALVQRATRGEGRRESITIPGEQCRRKLTKRLGERRLLRWIDDPFKRSCSSWTRMSP